MALSESQKKAVSHVKGPLLCLAGPGSGKTTVITARTRFLIAVPYTHLTLPTILRV